MQISLFENVKITNLFKQKKWDVDEINKSSLFHRYMRVYETLNPAEREVFFKLSEEYQQIPLSSYKDYLLNLLELIVEKYLDGKQTIYIYPMKTMRDSKKIKSSDVVSYLTRGTFMKYSDALVGKNFSIIKDFEELERKAENIAQKGHSVILLDDFIGSGKYASKVLDEVKKTHIDPSKIIIGALFITEKGYHRLNSRHKHIEYGEKLKPVTDKLTKSELEILKQIEEKLEVSEEYQLGYGQTASVISLIRTPNNTLPIFCYQKDAPFRRY